MGFLEVELMPGCIAAGEWGFHPHHPWELFFQGHSVKEGAQKKKKKKSLAGDGG